MTDGLPIDSDTPPDHVVIGLRLDQDTLPEWFERIMEVAPDWVRRIAVIERPDAWHMKVELHQSKLDGFKAMLAEEWEKFQIAQG